MEPRNPSTEAARKNVLVVDSDAQSLRIVDVSLRRAGFEVTHATDGLVAASLIERNPPPDLVISDLDLPGLDGLELCRRAKAPQRKIPFIFLARPGTDNKVRAVRARRRRLPLEAGLRQGGAGCVSARCCSGTSASASSSAEAPAIASQAACRICRPSICCQTIATNGSRASLHLHSSSGRTPARSTSARAPSSTPRSGVCRAATRSTACSPGPTGRFEIEWRNIRRTRHRRDRRAGSPDGGHAAARRVDGASPARLPPLDTIFEVDYRLLAERLADIPDEVNGILRLFDGVRTRCRSSTTAVSRTSTPWPSSASSNSEELIRNVEAKVVEPERGRPGSRGLAQRHAAGPPAAAPPAAKTMRALAPRVGPASRDRADARVRSGGERVRNAKSAGPRRALSPAPAARPRRSHLRTHRSAEPRPTCAGRAGGGDSLFPTSSPSSRTTLVSSSGGPAAAVVGEISNGVTAASAAHRCIADAAAARPALRAARSVSIPRSTDPGLGPLAPVTVVTSPPAAAPPVAPRRLPAVATPPVAAPAPAAPRRRPQPPRTRRPRPRIGPRPEHVAPRLPYAAGRVATRRPRFQSCPSPTRPHAG